MSKLKFYRGIEALYSAVTHADGIYFATDTHKIFMNGAQYGGSDGKTIADVAPKTGDPSKIVVTYTDETTKEISVGKTTYSSAIEDKALTMPDKVGGIAKGTKVSDLEGRQYDSILDDLLFPTVKPIYTLPKATLALASGSATREVGSAAPLAQDFRKTFDKGAITLNGVKQNNRAGDSVNEILYYGGQEANVALPTAVALGNTAYNYKVEYEAGPQPKDNKGNNADSPLAAGSVVSAALTINGTYPWYATTVAEATDTKQALIAWNATAGAMVTPAFVLKPKSEGGRQAFKLPRRATYLEQLNTLSGKYEQASLSDWTETEKSETINGNAVTYYMYEYAGDARGAVTLKVKF